MSTAEGMISTPDQDGPVGEATLCAEKEPDASCNTLGDANEQELKPASSSCVPLQASTSQISTVNTRK